MSRVIEVVRPRRIAIALLLLAWMTGPSSAWELGDGDGCSVQAPPVTTTVTP